jgi:hypothetical protein
MSGSPSSTVRTRKNVLTLGNPGDDLDLGGEVVAVHGGCRYRAELWMFKR